MVVVGDGQGGYLVFYLDKEFGDDRFAPYCHPLEES